MLQAVTQTDLSFDFIFDGKIKKNRLNKRICEKFIKTNKLLI